MSQDLLHNGTIYYGLQPIDEHRDESSSPVDDTNIAIPSDANQPQENGQEDSLHVPAKKTKRTTIPVKRTNKNPPVRDLVLAAKKTPTRARNKNVKQASEMNQKMTELQERNVDLNETLQQTRSELVKQQIQVQLMGCQLVSERQDFFSILDCYHHRVLACIHANKLEDLEQLTQKMNDFRNEYTRLNQKLIQDVKTWIFKTT